MLKKGILLFILALMLLSSSCNQSSKPIHTSSPNVSTAPTQNIRQQPSYITAESVIRKLASKEFKGRLLGTEENKKAAQYISDTFTTIGLEKYSKESYMFSYTQEDSFDWLKNSKETSSSVTVESRIKDGTNAQHIIGVIPGKDHSKAIVLTAHFDHIGTDEDGNVFCGALDNASGIGVLIDIAQIMKARTDSLSQDIVICALNGEEEGLQAAGVLAEDLKTKYKSLYNIDFDCIGVQGDNNIIFAGDTTVSGKLIDEMKKQFIKTGIQSTVWDSNGMEYFEKEYSVQDGKMVGRAFTNSLAFSKKGISSVTLIQNIIHEYPYIKDLLAKTDPKPYLIHSISDTEDKIDFKYIEKVSDVVCSFISGNAG